MTDGTALLDLSDAASELRSYATLLALALEQRGHDPSCAPVREALAAGAALVQDRAGALADGLARLQEQERTLRSVA